MCEGIQLLIEEGIPLKKGPESQRRPDTELILKRILRLEIYTAPR